MTGVVDAGIVIWEKRLEIVKEMLPRATRARFRNGNRMTDIRRLVSPMRPIYVEDGLTIRFPHRCADFVEGVEIGLLVASLSTGAPRIVCCLSPEVLEQATSLAARMGYQKVHESPAGEWTRLAFRFGSARPTLKRVHSHPEHGRVSG